jgi:hypothetical protein
MSGRVRSTTIAHRGRLRGRERSASAPCPQASTRKPDSARARVRNSRMVVSSSTTSNRMGLPLGCAPRTSANASSRRPCAVEEIAFRLLRRWASEITQDYNAFIVRTAVGSVIGRTGLTGVSGNRRACGRGGAWGSLLRGRDAVGSEGGGPAPQYAQRGQPLRFARDCRMSTRGCTSFSCT